jgi:hypothetical protein
LTTFDLPLIGRKRRLGRLIDIRKRPVIRFTGHLTDNGATLSRADGRIAEAA